jgi:anti-sigma-K factor RskA
VLSTGQGVDVARIVLLPDGTGYLKNDRMAPLDTGHTYQLWSTSTNTGHNIAISLGVLGPNPSAASFRSAPDVTGFAITVEPAGGVPLLNHAPYAVATVT